jgi:hypothetical protein
LTCCSKETLFYKQPFLQRRAEMGHASSGVARCNLPSPLQMETFSPQ